MESKKNTSEIIKKLALTNALLIAYFWLPNVTSFILMVVVSALYLCSECLDKSLEC